MPYWCARTEPARERVAERFLAMAGYEVYCPRLKERSAIRVLFPSYLFVTATAGWYRARWSIGAVGLIGLEGREPTRLADAVVEAIRKREKAGLVVLPQPAGFHRGDRVKIVHGPLLGLEGLVEGLRPQQRCEVLLQLLGKVELSRGDIEAI
jgi:transcription antitermination factor NusG